MPKYAGRCLKPAQDRGPELPDKCSIPALDPLAALGGLDCDGIGIDELAVACDWPCRNWVTVTLLRAVTP